jgi:hypothetical protein
MDNNKPKRDNEPTPEDFIIFGKDIQNKRGRRIGSAVEEEQAFHAFFGTTAPVAKALWTLLTEHTLVPEEGMIKHLLWTLECVEADDGYVGEAPRQAKCPACAANPKQNLAMQSHV